MRAGGGDWVSNVGAASVEVMQQLGWLDDDQRRLLRPWRAHAIINARGEHRPAFTLQTP